MLTENSLRLDHFGIADMQLPSIAGTYKGKLLIVASGRCVWDDLAHLAKKARHGLEAIRWDGDVMAVNDIGMHLPVRIAHWYSNDGYMLPHWHSARRPEFREHLDDRPTQFHSFLPKDSGAWKWPWPGHGGSGLQAVYTGLGLGYDEILIAGMPADDSGHYFDPPWVHTTFSRQVPPQVDDEENRWWKTARTKMFEGRVKSLSGRTKAWLR